MYHRLPRAASIVLDMNSAFPADIVGLQVTEHGTDACVVTVTGEVDALTAPELADCLKQVVRRFDCLISSLQPAHEEFVYLSAEVRPIVFVGNSSDYPPPVSLLPPLSAS